MSIAQEVETGKTEQVIRAAVELAAFVKQAAEEGRAMHDLEQGVWDRVLQMGRQAVQAFLDLLGTGDVGQTMSLPDGEVVRRLKQPHRRPYLSIFGAFEIARTVYGSREGQAIRCVPLDARLQLPESKFSYVLQDWDQFVACEAPYAEVSEFLQRILGFSQHVDSLERMSRQMSQEVEWFRDAQPVPPPEEEGPIVVESADGKGVPIRRPADAPRIADHQRRRGPKKDRKRMATVGTVYTIEPYIRTPQDVLEALFRRPEEARRESGRPRPCHKRVCASLSIESHQEDKARDGMATVFGWISQQQEHRNPQGRKSTVRVMDGQEALWDRLWQFEPQVAAVEILDLLHVTQRVWQAAHLFHAPESAAAEEFVRDRVLRILRGEVGYVIGGLRQMATKRDLNDAKRRTLETICGYLEANRGRMRYDDYLARGYPIASGAIEGACRHYVKDRMERAGMTWTKPGAQAILDLRSTYLNGDWDAFLTFRIERETKRLYPHRAALAAVTWTLAV